MKKLILIVLLFFFNVQLKAQYFDTVSIHYAIGDATIDKHATITLDSLSKTIKDKKNTYLQLRRLSRHRKT